MRLPRGTVVKICGNGGCIVRVVNDYGPQKKSRVVDLYRPDFFAICGCPSCVRHDPGHGVRLLTLPRGILPLSLQPRPREAAREAR